MKVVVSDLSWPLQLVTWVAGWTLLGAFLLGFVAAFVGIFRANFRAGLLFTPAEDWKESTLGRFYKRNKRMGQIFTSEKFWLERRLIFYGTASCVGSLAITLLIGLLFGR